MLKRPSMFCKGLALLTLVLIGSTRTARAQDVSLWPFFVFHRDVDQTEIDVLWPAYQYSREGADSRQMHILWPLTGFTREGQQRHNWILPFFFWGRTAPDRRYGVLFPLAGTLPDRGVTWFGNLIYRDDGENQLYGALPFYFQRGPSTWGAGVPPLFWSVTDNRLDEILLFPLAWWTDPDSWGVFPLLWRDGDWWASFPLFGHHTQSAGDWYLLFPLRVHTVDYDMETEHILWPFFALGIETYGIRWRVWPFVGYQGRRWAHGNVPRRKTTYFLWPLFWRHRDWDRHGVLMHSHLVAAPLFLSFGRRFPDEPFERTTVVPPLLAWWKTKAGRMQRLAVLFPIYHQSWDEPTQETTWRVLWAAARGRHGPNMSDVRVLRGVYHHARRDTHITDEIFPLFLWERDPRARTVEVSFLWRFAQYTREGDERGLRLLFLPWRIPL